MWTISSPDRRQLGPQHALLCVKQAKAYLDDVLAMGWEEAYSRIREHELTQWFQNKGNFCRAASENGAGEGSIRAFLGGAFAKGHGVRDALAILTSGQRKAPAATEKPTGAGTTGRVVLGTCIHDRA